MKRPCGQSACDKEHNYNFYRKYTRWRVLFPGTFIAVLMMEGQSCSHISGHLPLLSPNWCKIDSSGHLSAHPTETGRVEVTHGCHGPSDTMSHRMLSQSARSLGSRGKALFGSSHMLAAIWARFHSVSASAF